MSHRVLNQGALVEIDGEQWRIREISYGQAKRLSGRIMEIVRQIRASRPDLDFAKLASTDMMTVGYEALPILIASVADALEEIVAAVVTSDRDGSTPAVDEWPTSHYLRLLTAVIGEHRRTIDVFFGLLRVVESIRGNGTPSTRRRASSPDSSGQDSGTTNASTS